MSPEVIAALKETRVIMADLSEFQVGRIIMLIQELDQPYSVVELNKIRDLVKHIAMVDGIQAMNLISYIIGMDMDK